MSWTSKVIWSEGMFLRPQHFQQHDRYLEAHIEDRCGPLQSFPWGIRELEFSEEALKLGKIELNVCRGVMPDGTTFNIPKADEPPVSIELDLHTKDQIVYLSLLEKRPNATEVSREEDVESATRLQVNIVEVRDASMESGSTAPLELGRKRLQLMLEDEERAEYTNLGLLRVVEVRSNKEIVLDKRYIPPSLECRNNPRLYGFIKEIQALLKQRGDALAGRVDAAGRGGQAEMGDFLLLQVVNRYRPLFEHLLELPGYHPESLFQLGLQMTGELATFTADDKKPAQMPRYLHEDHVGSFEPLMNEIRRTLSTVLDQNAVLIPLVERKHGFRKAEIKDRRKNSQPDSRPGKNRLAG
jgi:type VI secretion system protein ImpJ